MSLRTALEDLRDYLLDDDCFGVGDPVFGTFAHAGKLAGQIALVEGGHRRLRDQAAQDLALWRRTGPDTPLHSGDDCRWFGELTADVVASECVGITGLHEYAYRVVLTIWHQVDYNVQLAEYSWTAQELGMYMEWCRKRLLGAPTLAGQLACVAPDGVATVEILPEEDWHGVLCHKATLTLDVIERELITMTWS